MSLIECYWMLQNSRVTAFTVFELLRENQKNTPHPPPPPHPQIRVKYFRFQFIFYVKTATPLPPGKGHPYLSQQPHSEILRSEVRSCQARPFWKFSKMFNLPNPQQKWRRGAHCEVCLNVNMMAQLICALLFKSWKICHEIDASWYVK